MGQTPQEKPIELTLNATLAGDPADVVCFDRTDSVRTRDDLIALAARVRAELARHEAMSWALDLDNAFEFAAALIGTWAAGKTVVVAPAPLLRGAGSALSYDGILVSGMDAAAGSVADRRSEAAARPARRAQTAGMVVDLAGLPLTDDRALQIDPLADVILYTSGSTGDPKEIRRKLHNMTAEISVFQQYWMHDSGPPCRFLATVTHRHVYGLLFRLLWPLLSKQPFAEYDLDYPEQIRTAAGERDILIASPALLKRLGHLESGRRPWHLVFSSGGLLTRDAATESSRVLGTCPVEVLGSTETSGVAWRRQLDGGGEDWQKLSLVAVRADSEGFLEVESPFTGVDGWLRMGDLVEFVSDTTFRLLGRGDRIVKVEDKRVSLTAIEKSLMQSPWIDDVAAVALSRSGRQYVGAVLQLSAAGTEELERTGKSAFGAALRPLLGSIEAVAHPRLYRYVARIPENAQGKRERHVLVGLFE